VPRSLSQTARELQAQIQAVAGAPPNEPDIQALWSALDALEARLSAVEAVTKKLKL
jgi:hypothetical protein